MYNRRIFLQTAALATAGHAALPVALTAAATVEGDPLATLRRSHPRLLATASDFERLQTARSSPGMIAGGYARLRERGERVLKEAPAKYEIPDGLRLLSTSRKVLDRITLLGLLWQLDGDTRWAERAGRELEAVAAFPDWNPRHFLDTAEMTAAFAFGYDWLHAFWNEEQKTAWRTAMMKFGLSPALEAYRGKASFGWWVKSRHNWNQVCNGGIGLGALALAEAEPEAAREILRAAIRSLPLAMAEFAPDGGWIEGPGYWDYATQYNVAILAAFQTALGTDFGLGDQPGFAATGFFPIHLTGPLGKTFNYADGGDSRPRAPQLFWLANRYRQPAFAWYQAQGSAGEPLDLLWRDPAADLKTAPQLEAGRCFHGPEVAAARGSWSDPDTTFVAFKAGNNAANHGNLDLGTFVLDALGKRWAVDLGADNYNLPGYFGKQRWDYYRLRAEGHNTLVINPDRLPDQDPGAFVKLERWRCSTARTGATMDLSPAYARHRCRVQRGLALLEGRHVLVLDEFTAAEPVDLWWFMHTPAQVEVAADGHAATLTLADRILSARLLEPVGARFEVLPATPLGGSPQPAGQAPNSGIRKLALHLPKVRAGRLAVLLSPGSELPPAGPLLTPLAEW